MLFLHHACLSSIPLLSPWFSKVSTVYLSLLFPLYLHSISLLPVLSLFSSFFFSFFFFFGSTPDRVFLTPARAVRVSSQLYHNNKTKLTKRYIVSVPTRRPVEIRYRFDSPALDSLHGSLFAVSPQTESVFRVPSKNGQVQGQQRPGRSLCARHSLHFHRMSMSSVSTLLWFGC